MNKRVYFILLPILALLFILSGGQRNVARFQPVSQFSVRGNSRQQHASHSVNLAKNDSHQKKNKIRIKACDDYSALEVAEMSVPSSPIFYYCKPAYKVCAVYFLSAHYSEYNLRGPPSNNG